MARSKRVIIFTGPDGAGKTTIAQHYAAKMGALYVHHGPYPKVHSGLARLYYESMMPALMGYQDVVLDRCWLDEPIYSDAMARGASRIGYVFQRMLERAALRCNAVVFNCLPAWSTVVSNYRIKRGQEYVNTEERLYQIYTAYTQLYATTMTALPVVPYDYEEYINDNDRLYYLKTNDDPCVSGCHPLKYDSAGRWDAPIVMLGEAFADIKDRDSLRQVPFMSWSKEGVSQWFTQQLHNMVVSEHEMQWVNVDNCDIVEYLNIEGRFDTPPKIIALGDEAGRAALKAKIDHVHIPHPMYWKRFRIKEPYSALTSALHDARS